MGLVHQHRQAWPAMGMDQIHHGREVGGEPLVGGIHQHHRRGVKGCGGGKHPLQVASGGRLPQPGEGIEGEIKQQRFDLTQHTGVQQGAVQVAGQQHPGSRGRHRQEGRLKQAAGAIHPEPAALGAQQGGTGGLGLGHRTLRLQGPTEGWQFG